MFAALGNFFSWKLFEEKSCNFFDGLITHSPKQFIKLCYSKQIEILFFNFCYSKHKPFLNKKSKKYQIYQSMLILK